MTTGVGFGDMPKEPSRELFMVEPPITVGIVEDDPEIRDALECTLSCRGFQTELYESAEEFINAAKTSRAACLLVDIQLGDISGVELARQLSATNCSFPVIFMTGSDDAMLYKQAIDVGCVALLHKPFPADQLIESIMLATLAAPGKLSS
jgi:FixJ family two-component response regulator